MRRALPLSTVLLLAACSSGGGTSSTVLRADVIGEVDAPDSPVRDLLTQTTQLGLVQFDGGGHIIPGLAASWRTVDGGRSIIFRLRPVKWSNGKLLKAADVVAAFRRIMAPASRNPLKPLLTGLDNAEAVMAGRAPLAQLGVSAPLANVVEVRLSSPDAGLLQLLALPEAAVVRTDARPPSIGPFQLSGTGTQPFRLVANPRYFAADTLLLGEVRLFPAADPDPAIARFVRGDTDMVVGDGIVGLGAARTLGPRETLKLEPSWGVYGYRANVAKGPLADPRVRRALAMTVDRDDLVGRLFNLPMMVPLVSLVPPDAGSGATAAAVPDWAALDAAARTTMATQLLAQAGFGPANPLRITVALPPGREHRQVLDLIARGWSPLGVIASAVERAPADQRVAVANGDYDLALVERSAPTATPLFFLRPFTCAAGGDYCNPAADALVDGARAMADEDGRAEALAHAESAMLADMPMIPLFVPVRWTLVSRQVEGWTPNQAGQHPFTTLDIRGGKTR